MLAPHPEALRFRGLRPGDLVRLLSTSTEILTGWGLRVDAGKYVLAEHGYMAGHDQDRLDDVNPAYRDPDVRAISTASSPNSSAREHSVGSKRSPSAGSPATRTTSTKAGHCSTSSPTA